MRVGVVDSSTFCIQKEKILANLQLFDKIAVVDNGTCNCQCLFVEELKKHKEIIFFDDFFKNIDLTDYTEINQLLRDSSGYLTAAQYEYNEPYYQQYSSEEKIQCNDRMATYFEKSKELSIRAGVTLFNKQGMSSIAMLPGFQYIKENCFEKDVIQIEIKNFPIISEYFPVDELIYLTNDKEIIRRRCALRGWLRNAYKVYNSKREIIEKIQELIFEYEHYMKLQKIKYELRTLKACLNLPSDILTGIATLNISKITNPYFEIRLAKLDLLESECNAPGRELSLLVDLK